MRREYNSYVKEVEDYVKRCKDENKERLADLEGFELERELYYYDYTLYNEKSLPVDLVITPDVEIADFIYNLFKLPGSLSYYSFFRDKINIFS